MTGFCDECFEVVCVCTKAAVPPQAPGLASQVDCRLCHKFAWRGECLSVFPCVEGSQYHQSNLIQVWNGDTL